MQLNFSMTHLIYRLGAIFVLITMRKIANRITNDNDKKGTAGEIGAMLFHDGLISIFSVYKDFKPNASEYCADKT